MKLAIAVLLVGSFAQAGIVRFTAKHIVKPPVVAAAKTVRFVAKKVIW
jgi:hypothetical protein